MNKYYSGNTNSAGKSEKKGKCLHAQPAANVRLIKVLVDIRIHLHHNHNLRGERSQCVTGRASRLQCQLAPLECPPNPAFALPTTRPNFRQPTCTQHRWFLQPYSLISCRTSRTSTLGIYTRRCTFSLSVPPAAMNPHENAVSTSFSWLRTGQVKGTRFFITGKDRGAFVDPSKVSITPSWGEWREAEQSWNLPKDYAPLVPSGTLVYYTKGRT